MFKIQVFRVVTLSCRINYFRRFEGSMG